ncbi:MAG: hypothetical protein WC929_00680 [Bacilli bacterium]
MIAITKKDIVDMVVEEDPPIKENGWDGATSKSQLFDFARDEEGNLQKEKIENYFLKVEGDGLVESDYSYPVGKIVDGKPEYDLEGLQAAFSAAMGSHTGIEHEKLAERAANLAKENFGLEMLTDGMKDVLGIKENSAYVTASGDMVIEETTPINDYPNESNNADVAWTPEKAKQDLIEWATSDGKISKKKLMKYFLDVDGGDAQNVDSYRYVVGAIVDTEPQYCLRCLDDSWELASGKRTGVANRTVMKKIVFLKEREGMPLTEEQMEFTQRHMSAPINDSEIKLNEYVLQDASEMGNIAVVNSTDIKLNSALSGSKVIYEDDNVIDVPVVPMREGVFTGSDGVPTLKKFEYFSKDAHWLDGQPILKGHTAPTELVTYKHDRIGKLTNVMTRPDKKDVVAVARYYKNKLSPDDLAKIKSGIPYDGSIAYTTHTTFGDGEYDGKRYGAIEDGGYHFYHFADLGSERGACSHEEGCGFLLNEAPKTDSFYNELRRADITTTTNNNYSIKLNSKTCNDVILETNDKNEAIALSKTFVKNGNIPKQNKCNDDKKYNSQIVGNNMTEEYINPEDVQKLPVEEEKDDTVEAKLNEVDESLAMKDQEIASLKEQMAALQARLDDLLMKQQEAEKEEADKAAEEDFQAFGQKLNAAHRKDARVHYDNFLKTGWKYIAANPEVFKMDIPKMNARGIPAEGEDVSELSKARAELQKTLSSNYRRK